jgi:hypothetical protein
LTDDLQRHDANPDGEPLPVRPARLHAGLAIEAALALAVSALLCLNAWPWIVQHSETVGADPASGHTGAAITAVLLYGLAWPAIAAAAMGAQMFFFARLSAGSRALIAGTLLVITLASLLIR